MALSGNLQTFHISNVLQLLHNDQKTGLLKVTRENEAITVYIRDGSIIHATKSHEKNRLGDLLVKSGIINKKQLKECLKISQKENIPLGRIIVEKGYASAKEIGKTIFKQAENAIYDLFFWETGEFEYHDKEFPARGMVIKKINIMSTILEATRRLDEMAVLKKQIPDENRIFQVSGTVRDAEKIRLTPDEWSVLALIDGKNTVKGIINDSIHDRLTVYQILNSLISSGYIKETETLSPLQLAAKAFDQLKAVDTKTVRRGLDDLGLPRSSILRLIVTRISREAFSPEELLDLVETEAVKIVNTDDQIRLSDLMEKSQAPFLEHLLCLLHKTVEKVQEPCSLDG